MKVLRQFIDAWKENVESAHKKNEVIISEHEFSADGNAVEAGGNGDQSDD